MPKRRRRSRGDGRAEPNVNGNNGANHVNGVNGDVANKENEKDEEEAPYIVEEPSDEDCANKPKKAKKEETSEKINGSGDFSNDEEDWANYSLEDRIGQLFAGGVFYDNNSEDSTQQPSEEEANISDDGNDTEVEVSVEESGGDDSENESDNVYDDEAEDEDDMDEDGFEFTEDDIYGSDSDNQMLFDELDSLGLEMDGASNQEPNSDEEIENVIASIRPRDEEFARSGSEKTESDAESEVVGPVDDLEELASADEADLHEDDDYEGEEEVDGFVVDDDDIEMISSEDSSVDDDLAEDSDEDDDEEEDVDETNVSDQFRAHSKTECSIEGYRTVKDSGLLLYLDRTSAPKSRSGAFRPFKFTEKKLGDVHSVEVAEDAFSWMVGPLEVHYFYRYIFQRSCYFVTRRDNNYFKGLFSSDALLHMAQKNYLRYGENINVATYTKEGGRKTHNLEGRVFACQLKKFVESGCSIQCINPQSFSDEIWYLCEILQELTNSFVGANTYLTPANSAGFAPHWDEVDAFILQVEGKKYWRVWAPDDGDSALPDESSRNFTEHEMVSKNLVFEGTLEEGDTLYIPRGFYHSASTGNKPSLHVTVSLCHKVTFTHLMKSVADDVWDSIRSNRLLGRRSLPSHYMEMNGVAPLDYCHDYKTE